MSASTSGPWRTSGMARPTLPAPVLAGDAVLDVRDRGRGDHLDRLEGEIADVLEQPLACPERDRDDVEVELVEQAGGEVLLHGACPAGDLVVLVAGRSPGLLQRGFDSIGDEV